MKKKSKINHKQYKVKLKVLLKVNLIKKISFKIIYKMQFSSKCILIMKLNRKLKELINHPESMQIFSKNKNSKYLIYLEIKNDYIFKIII